MSKNLTVEQWIKIIKIYKKEGIKNAELSYRKLKGKFIKLSYEIHKRIRYKTKLLDNYGMKSLFRKSGSGRPKKRDDSDIPSIIDDLTDEQKREIIEDWIKIQRNKKDKKTLNILETLNISVKARILQYHRTSFYKKQITRTYKLDHIKNIVGKILIDSKFIYGSRKITILLNKQGITINDRTLRNYMIRWGFFIKTRRKKRNQESKNTNVKFLDLVKRDFNPEKDNIIATDVSYIPGLTKRNNFYLSVAISHKTKKVESWILSDRNDSELVMNTIKKIKKTNYILHSDHGSQYSSFQVQDLVKSLNCKTSMSRVGNSLDNREIEYFFGCLKGEYLNHLTTYKMKYHEIKHHINWYVNWYNNKRIQKRLNWKTPTSVGVNI